MPDHAVVERLSSGKKQLGLSLYSLLKFHLYWSEVKSDGIVNAIKKAALLVRISGNNRWF